MAAIRVSTLVLRSENVRSIGLKDRWWQTWPMTGVAWSHGFSAVCSNKAFYESTGSQARKSFGSQ
jgi:hypothetical protein